MKRSDSILANFYYQKVPKLPKYQNKGQVNIPGVTDFVMQKPVSESTSAGAMDRRLSANYAAQKGDEVENFIRDYQKKYPGISREKAMNAFNMSKQSVQNQGQIKKAAPKRSAASKALAIATNPMTALQYKVKGQDIPENFEKGERNRLDMAVDILNPFGIADAAASIPGNLSRGEFTQAGLNALSVFPSLAELRGLKGPAKKTLAESMGANLFGKKKAPTPTIPEEDKLQIIRGNYLKQDLPKNYVTDREVSQLFEKEKKWLQSDEYIKRRSASTGESPSAIKQDTDNIIKRFEKIKLIPEKSKTSSKNSLGSYDPKQNTINLNSDLFRDEVLDILDHEVKHAMSQLATTGKYGKYPVTKIGNTLSNFLKEKHNRYLSKPYEQQVRALRLLDHIEKKYGIPRGQKLSIEDVNRFADDVNPGGIYENDFWDNYFDVGDQIKGMVEGDQKLKFIPKNLLKMKFPFRYQSQGNLRKNLLDQLNKAYVVPAGIIGAAALQNNEEVPQQKMGGLIKAQNGFYYQMPRATSESTRIPQRDYELERQVRLRNTMAAQPQLRQARANTPAQEKERTRKNRAYASQQPNARIDEQGNVSRINPNRSVTGEAENFMSRREDKAAEHIMGALDAAGYATGAGELVSLGAKAVKPFIKKAVSKIDQKIYPTRAYRAEIPGGNITGYKKSDLSEKVFKKGDFATTKLGEAFDYLAGSGSGFGRKGLLSGDPVQFTEYKIPFWKKNVTFDKDVVALKQSQNWDANANEYIIPRNKFLYPRRTTTIQPVPEHVKDMETVLPSGLSVQLYTPSAIPQNYSSLQYASPPYKYMEDQINAVTGHRAPLTFDFDPSLGAVRQKSKMINWEQPKIAPNEGIGKFSGLFEKGGIIEDNRGQWAHPGKPTRISSSNITMEGVPYPVLAKANNGMTTMMYPEQDYYFPGADYVDEYPMMRRGGLVKYQKRGEVGNDEATNTLRSFINCNNIRGCSGGVNGGVGSMEASGKGFYAPMSNDPVTWEELQTYNEINPKSKEFKAYLKSLQSQFPGLTAQQLLAAGADSARVNLRKMDLERYDKPAEQTYDRAYHMFYRPLMNQPGRVTIPQILQHQPGGFFNIEQTVRSNYGRKKAQIGIQVEEDYSMEDPNQERFAIGMRPNVTGKGTVDAGAAEATEFLRNWYSGRIQDPRYGEVAEKRLEEIPKIGRKKASKKEMRRGAAAYYVTGGKDIYLNPENPFSISPTVQGHEMGHELYNQVPQPMQNEIISKNFIDEKSWKRQNPEKARSKRYGYKYYSSPSETASRLLEFRMRYNLDPKKKYTPEEMSQIMKLHIERGNKGLSPEQIESNRLSGDRNIDWLFNIIGNDPAKLAELNDEIVMNQKAMGNNVAKYGGLAKYQTKGQVSQQDSVRHLAGQIMDFEARKGSAQGTGLSNFGNPALGNNPSREQAVGWFMQNVAPGLGAFQTAMEKGEAGDFVYNTGRDPRVYMLDQYLKSIGQTGIPNRGSYNVDTKTPAWTPQLQQSLDDQWNTYKDAIYKLPVNTRRQLLNKGRDFYYQNINKKPDGSPSDAYHNTWKPRIWESVNTYKQQNGGDISIPNLRQAYYPMAYGGPMIRYMAGKMTGPNIF
jgi:hypothetical protein